MEAGVESGTANRDLKTMVAAGLLVAKGETRGRYYLGTDDLRQVYSEMRRTHRRQVVGPYTPSEPDALTAP